MHQLGSQQHNIGKNLASSRMISFMFCWWLLASLATSVQSSENLQHIEAVEYLLSDVSHVPNVDAEWQNLTLPFNTRLDPFDVTPESIETTWVWFRFKLEKPLDNEIYALLLWRLNLSAQVYFNGEHIGGNFQREGRTTVSWNRPLLVRIQSPAWQQGEGEVLIRLTRSRWGGNLAPVLFGPANELDKLYKARLNRQVEVNKILLAFGVFLALVTFIVWLSRRDDPVYLWFSGLALSWSVVTTHMMIYYISIPYSVWLPLVHVAIDICILCLHGFIGCIAGVRVVWRERAFIVWTAIAALVHLTVSPNWFFITAYSIHLVGAIVIGVILLRALVNSFRINDRTTMCICTAVGLQVMLFIYNAFLMFFDNDELWEGTIFFAHFGIPVLLVVFGTVLLNRFVNALNEAEALNSELEQKVEAGRAIIAKQYAEHRLLELNQAAERERLKIYRDLHDDVGSRLLTIIHSDPNNKLVDTARAALESLRQAVSRANTPDQRLVNFLIEVREETELRLIGSGHQVIWQQENNLPDILLPSEFVFNLNRVVKELVSNIIRHAQAVQVEVHVSFIEGSLVLIVSDDGQGFKVTISGGNGIGNIKSRIQELGGEVNWENTGEGTQVRVRVPLL